MKEHDHIMHWTDRSLDRKFGKESKTSKYPFSMKKKKSAVVCPICYLRRTPKDEFIRGKHRHCYELGRQYKDKDLTKFAATRIKLARTLHVRP